MNLRSLLRISAGLSLAAMAGRSVLIPHVIEGPNHVGSTYCAHCPAGKFSENQGESTCEECDAGKVRKGNEENLDPSSISKTLTPSPLSHFTVSC